MTTTQAKEKLYALEARLCAFEHAAGLLYYDGDTAAPSGTADNRGRTLSVLNEEIYQLVTSDETREILTTLKAAENELDKKTNRIVTLFLRSMEETARIPMDEYVEFQRLTNESSAVWHEAKLADDYARFAPYIDKIVGTLRRFAGYVRPELSAYDYLLNKYEPGLTTETLDRFFADLRESIVPLIARVCAAKPIDESPLHVPFPIDKQRALTDAVMKRMLLDRAHVGVGETEHPFTTNFSKYDVRITTHYFADNFASGMFSTIHEGGHALYESNTGDELAYTRLGEGVSMAVHESQSRFYENIIGRSRAFVSLIAPELRALCPALEGVSEEALYRAFNASKPSLIRTEADELTYCLHILVRYEIEKKLFAGELTAKELPAEWNRMYREYLGVDVPGDREGVLQDSHWSNGMFGYFPSYALGSAYAAQLFSKMKETVDVDGDVARGDLSRVNEWLRARIWQYGSLREPGTLMEAAFEAPFDPTYYVRYLKEKYEALYR